MTDCIKYNNSAVRKQDRLLERDDAIELLRMSEYGVLSMVETFHGETGGYALPINYVWDGMRSIYLHCALEGYKLDCLKEYSRVSFCVVGRTQVISHAFTTAYESILVRGVMNMELVPDKCRYALELMLDKYSPNDKNAGMKYIEKLFYRTHVMRLDIEEISGKTRRIEP